MSNRDDKTILKAYTKLISGKLTSPDNQPDVDVDVTNGTHAALYVNKVNYYGEFDQTYKIDAMGSTTVSTAIDQWLVVTTVQTGAFVTAIQVSSAMGDDGLTIGTGDILPPNGFGGPPVSSSTSPVPANPLPVCVGISNPGPNETIIVRQQSWQLDPSTYSLGPRERQQVSLSQSSGVDTSSDEMKAVSQAYGFDESGGGSFLGWSASVSATQQLNMSSQTSSAVSMAKQTTSTRIRTLGNPSRAQGLMVLMWALTDTLHYLDGSADGGDPKTITILDVSPGVMVPMPSRVGHDGVEPGMPKLPANEPRGRHDGETG